MGPERKHERMQGRGTGGEVQVERYRRRGEHGEVSQEEHNQNDAGGSTVESANIISHKQISRTNRYLVQTG